MACLCSSLGSWHTASSLMPLKKGNRSRYWGCCRNDLEEVVRKVDDESLHRALKMPAVHLAGDHGIELKRFYIESGEVDGVGAFAFSKKYQVVKGMAMGEMKVLIIFVQVAGKPVGQEIVIGSWFFADAADIIHRYVFLCHGEAGLRNKATYEKCNPHGII